MTVQGQTAALFVDAQRPLVLAGPPQNLRGQFRVQNGSDRKLVIKQPLLKANAARGEGSRFLPEQVLRRIIVRAGQSRAVDLALSLDPSTPPGTYHACLEVEGQTREVVVHVAEHVALRIEPELLVFPSNAGGHFSKSVAFVNEGNVAINIKSIGRVLLDEELAHCRVVRGAILELDENVRDLDSVVATLARRYRAGFPSLIMKVENQALTLEPGDTVSSTCSVTLPKELNRHYRYGASAPISTSNLGFSLVPD